MTPAGIARRQREEVARYVRRHPGATLKQIGDALVLPVWSIELRLAELNGLPVPYKNPNRKAE